jgi:hypothetical protein
MLVERFKYGKFFLQNMIKEPQNWKEYEKLKKELDSISPEDPRYEGLCKYLGIYPLEERSNLEDLSNKGQE